MDEHPDLRPSSQTIFGRGFPIQCEPELEESRFDGQLRRASSIISLILEHSSARVNEFCNPNGSEFGFSRYWICIIVIDALWAFGHGTLDPLAIHVYYN